MTAPNPYESIRGIVLQGLDVALNGQEVLDLTRASHIVAAALQHAVIVRPTAADTSWQLLLNSLTVFDPYDVMTPEARAMYPLSEDMIEQNRALMAWAVGDTYGMGLGEPA
jgi:hypothetical protein